MFRSVFIVLLLFLSAPLIASAPPVRPLPVSDAHEAALRKTAASVYRTLSKKQRLGQLFMLHVFLNPRHRQFGKFMPGGIFLNALNTYTRIRKGKRRVQNWRKLKKQLRKINRMYIAKKVPPPLYSIDQEGGYHRLLGKATYFPTLMAVGEAARAEGDPSLAAYTGFYTCRDLQEVGIHWNLSPVTDVQMNPRNPVIRTRSFHSDPKFVANLVENYLSGHKTARCLDAVKHFPGHGDTHRDSHHSLPVVKKSWQTLTKEDLLPFRYLLKERALPTGVMPAHIVYPRFEKKPATFSKYWLKKILRMKWDFQGLVITDNLAMRAVTKFRRKRDFRSTGVDALVAGADVLLLTGWVGHYGSQMYSGLRAAAKKRRVKKRVAESVKRILYYKLLSGAMDDYLRAMQRQRHRSVAGLQKEVKLILAESKRRTQNRDDIARKLQPAPLINKKVSTAAVKILFGNKKSAKKIANLHKRVVFTDLPTSSKSYKRLKKKHPAVYPLALLNKLAGKYRKIAILNTRVWTLRSNIHKWRRRRKRGNWVIYSVANPYPFNHLKRNLRRGDVLVSPFSKSPASRRALYWAFQKQRELPRATVNIGRL